jgi:hypothetical protein
MISPFGRMFGLAALIAALSLASATVAGDADKNWFVRCEGAFNLCGYADRASMRTVIPARFEMARPFSEGLAAVRVKGRFGYIDETGTLVIAPRFVEAGAFRGGYAEVRIDGASGIIDRHGQLVVPAAFQRIIPLAGEVFIAQPLPARSPSTLFEPNFSSEAGDGFYFATDGLGPLSARPGLGHNAGSFLRPVGPVPARPDLGRAKGCGRIRYLGPDAQRWLVAGHPALFPCAAIGGGSRDRARQRPSADPGGCAIGR